MTLKIQLLFNIAKNAFFSLAIVIFILGVIGCGPGPDGNSTTLATNDPYPSQPTLPPVQNEAYPIPTPANGILLAITKPVNLDDEEIHGVGPAGLPIVIKNITLMGEQIGAGIIGADGTFSIPVTLQSNIRIGLSADIEAFGLTAKDIQPGDDAMTVPLVGYFYDTARVQE